MPFIINCLGAGKRRGKRQAVLPPRVFRANAATSNKSKDKKKTSKDKSTGIFLNVKVKVTVQVKVTAKVRDFSIFQSCKIYIFLQPHRISISPQTSSSMEHIGRSLILYMGRGTQRHTLRMAVQTACVCGQQPATLMPSSTNIPSARV